MISRVNFLKSLTLFVLRSKIVSQSELFHFMKPKISYIYLRCLKESLILQGVSHFGAGGAIGFDTIAALCVLEIREIYPQIALDLILPCKDQSNTWDELNKRTYNYILSNADSVEYISDKYAAGCMYERNRRLVDGSRYCIAYSTHNSGGTAYTCSYASKRNLEIINIYDMLRRNTPYTSDIQNT